MTSPDSRLLEMIDATVAREKIDTRNSQIGPNMNPQLKEALAAVFAVKFSLYGRCLPQGMFEDLREDVSFVLMALLGKDSMSGPGFRAAYDAASKDILESLKRRGMGQ